MNTPLPSWLLYLAALISGSAITLSLTPFDYWPLAILALVALHLLFSYSDRKTSLKIAALFGVGVIFSSSHWIYISLHDHGDINAPLAALFTFGLCSFIGLWFVPLAWLYKRFIAHSILGQSLGFAAIWYFNEWLRTWFLTGFPWAFIGYSQLDGPLASLAPLIGTLGISFILALSAALVSLLIQRKISPFSLAIPLIFLVLAWSVKDITWTQKKSDKAYSIAMVQGNIPLDEKWAPEHRAPIMQYYLDEVEKLAGTDIILLPETAIPEFTHHPRAIAWVEHVDKILKPAHSALISGFVNAKFQGNEYEIYNVMATAGDAYGMYYKHKLVPFGEFVPLEHFLRGLIDLPMSSFSAGPVLQAPLFAKDINIQPYICYEIVYPDFVSQSAGQADLLLTVSNDSWFGDSIGPLQHLQMARMRALETGRYLIRSTNNGVTAVINPQGEIIDRIARFEKGVLKSSVYAMQGLTPVMRYGTLPLTIFSLLSLIFIHRFKPSTN